MVRLKEQDILSDGKKHNPRLHIQRRHLERGTVSGVSAAAKYMSGQKWLPKRRRTHSDDLINLPVLQPFIALDN